MCAMLGMSDVGFGMGWAERPAHALPTAPNPAKARDVLATLVEERADSADCFRWHSQLRYYANEATKECQARHWHGIGRGTRSGVGLRSGARTATLLPSNAFFSFPLRSTFAMPRFHTATNTWATAAAYASPP